MLADSRAPDATSRNGTTSIPTQPPSDVPGEEAQIVQRLQTVMDNILKFEEMVEIFDDLPASSTYVDRYVSDTANLFDTIASCELPAPLQIPNALEWFRTLINRFSQ